MFSLTLALLYAVPVLAVVSLVISAIRGDKPEPCVDQRRFRR